MSQLTVKNHRPIQWSLAIVITSMFIAIFTWFMLDNSHWSVIYDRIRGNQGYEQLIAEHRKLEDENSELQHRLMMMQRLKKLDNETASLLQEEIKNMQNEIYSLKEELEFYQSIMTMARDTKGLNIHGIHIEPLPPPRNYHLKLVLTHVTKSVKVVEGRLEVVFEGVQNGKNSRLNLQDVILDDLRNFKFELRNFTRFESNIELPEGFVPRRVFVQLFPKSNKQSRIKKVFDWPASAT